MTAFDENSYRVVTFQAIGNSTQVITTGDIRNLKPEDEGKYIENSYSGTSKKIWHVEYMAPGDAAGPITFYAAGVAADGDGYPRDDYVYKKKKKIYPEGGDS
jgi:hypothetical protein